MERIYQFLDLQIFLEVIINTMGAQQSQNSAARSDKAVRRRLKREAKSKALAFKVLFTGKRGAGVNTIINQILVLHGQPVGEEDRTAARSIIFRGLVENTRKVIQACGTIEGTSKLDSMDSKRAAKVINNCDTAKGLEELPESIAHAITVLWNDVHVQSAWERRSKFQVWDRWGEFAAQCENYPRWGGPKWRPSSVDCFAATVLSTNKNPRIDNFSCTGVSVELSRIKGEDLTYQTSQKWLPILALTNMTTFVVDLAEYDQMGETNGLEEAMDNFEGLTSIAELKHSAMFLLLNKDDLFRQKLCEQRIPLNVTGRFPTAPAGYSYDEAAEWVQNEFAARAKSKLSELFVYFSVGIDEEIMKAIIHAGKLVVLQRNIEAAGIITY